MEPTSRAGILPGTHHFGNGVNKVPGLLETWRSWSQPSQTGWSTSNETVSAVSRQWVLVLEALESHGPAVRWPTEGGNATGLKAGLLTWERKQGVWPLSLQAMLQ